MIGCGRVAVGHVGGWLDSKRPVEIRALIDPEPAHARELQQKKGLDNARILSDYHQILGDDDIDAVDICSPSPNHARQIMDALAAGKHVLTEKPTGYSLEECRELRWYAGRYREQKVAVAYSLRYYPTNVAAKREIDRGSIGQPMYAQVVHSHAGDRSRVFDRGGERGDGFIRSDLGGRYIAGSDMTHATHPFDFARYILGEVREVFAFSEGFGTFATLRHTSGALSQVTNGSSSKMGQSVPYALCVQGTEGTLVTWNEVGKVSSQPGGYRGHVVRNGKKREFTPKTRDTYHGDVGRCRNFYDAVRKGTPLICDLVDGIRTSELLHAIADSHDHEIRVPVHQAHKTG
jgi:predicted dehydrogenase